MLSMSFGVLVAAVLIATVLASLYFGYLYTTGNTGRFHMAADRSAEAMALYCGIPIATAVVIKHEGHLARYKSASYQRHTHVVGTLRESLPELTSKLCDVKLPAEVVDAYILTLVNGLSLRQLESASKRLANNVRRMECANWQTCYGYLTYNNIPRLAQRAASTLVAQLLSTNGNFTNGLKDLSTAFEAAVVLKAADRAENDKRLQVALLMQELVSTITIGDAFALADTLPIRTDVQASIAASNLLSNYKAAQQETVAALHRLLRYNKALLLPRLEDLLKNQFITYTADELTTGLATLRAEVTAPHNLSRNERYRINYAFDQVQVTLLHLHTLVETLHQQAPALAMAMEPPQALLHRKPPPLPETPEDRSYLRLLER